MLGVRFPGQSNAFVYGLVVSFLGALLWLMPFGMKLEEEIGLKWLFHLRGMRNAPSEVIIVSIDKASAETLELKNEPEQWPRSMHGQLVRELQKLGAVVVGFNIGFDKPRRDETEDRAFALAMRDAGNVILSDYIKPEVSPTFFRERLIQPITLLKNTAVASAPFPLPRSGTDIKWVWTFKTSAGGAATLPVVAFHLFVARTASDYIAELADPLNNQHAKAFSQLQDILTHETDIYAQIDKLKRLFKGQPSDFDSFPATVESSGVLNPHSEILSAWVKMYRLGDSHYLNHYGSARSITTVPYHQILNHTLPAQNIFEGKAVFVGFSEDFKPEERLGFHNVFSRSDGINISEVEIAATCFANLIESASIQPLDSTYEFFLILAWGFLITLLCHSTTINRAAIYTILMTVGFLAVAQAQFKISHIWWPLVIPLGIQAPFAFFSALLSRYLTIKQEWVNVSDAFERFIPKEEVKKLAKNRYRQNLTQNNQLMQGVCLYTDIEQYTAISEKMEPTAVMELLNKYFDAIHRPITRHHGIVSDTIGDAMLAIWATPQPDRSTRADACRAALEIHQAVENFNRTSPVALPTRIGLHYGQIVLGHVGSVEHFEYRAVGDIVNTANRIEGLNKLVGTRLLVSEDTIDQLDEFVTRDLGLFPIRGKSETIIIHELICSQQNVTPEKKVLCDLFEEARAQFKIQRWQEAEAILSQILDTHPTDGPSLYYLDRCRQNKQE